MWRKLAIFLVLTAPLSALDMHLDDANLWLEGDILIGDEDRLQEQLETHQNIINVKLESRGGDVYTAIQIGRKLRRNKINTIVTGDCLSACTLIFIGGFQRLTEGGTIGFHLVQDKETGKIVGLEDGLYNRVTMYAWGMGVDPIRFVQWMTFASPEGIYFPDEAELCSANILNSCD